MNTIDAVNNQLYPVVLSVIQTWKIENSSWSKRTEIALVKKIKINNNLYL